MEQSEKKGLGEIKNNYENKKKFNRQARRKCQGDLQEGRTKLKRDGNYERRTEMEDVQIPFVRSLRKSGQRRGEKIIKENAPDLKKDTGLHVKRANQVLSRMKKKDKQQGISWWNSGLLKLQRRSPTLSETKSSHQERKRAEGAVRLDTFQISEDSGTKPSNI